MTLIRNIFRITATSGSAIFLFLLLVAAGRVLGPQDFGRFSFALAVAVVLAPLLDPGLYQLLVREVTRERSSSARYLLHSLAWKVVAAPLLLLAIHYAIPHLDPSPITIHAVYLIAISQVFKSMTDAIRGTLSANERFARGIASLGAERFMLLSAGVFTLQVGGGLQGLCIAFVVVRLLDLLLAWLLARGPLGENLFQFDPVFLGEMLAAGAPIGVWLVFSNLYGYLDTFMLSVMRTQTEVGHYNAAYRVFEGVAVSALIWGTALMPRLERYQKDQPVAFQTVFGSGIKYAYGFGALLAGNALLLAPLIVRFFFGGGYEPSILSLRILVAGFPVVFVMNFMNATLVSGRRWKAALFSSLAGVALNGALNRWLIPLYSQDGAAAATVISEALLFVVMYFVLRKEAPGIARHVFGILPLAIGVAAAAAWFTMDFGLAAQLAAGNAAFIGIALLAGVVTESERRALLDALPGR